MAPKVTKVTDGQISPGIAKPSSSISYDICRPLIVVGQLCGLLSLDLNLLRVRTGRRSHWLIRTCCFLFRAAVIVLPFGYFYYQLESHAAALTKVHHNTVDIMVENMDLGSSFTYRLLVCIVCFVKEGNVRSMLKSLGNMDPLLINKMSKWRYMAKFCVVNVLPVTFYVILCQLTDVSKTDNLLGLKLVSITILILSEFYAAIFFMVCADLCARSFKALKDDLQETLHVPSTFPLDRQLRRIRTGYSEAYQLAASLEDAFSLLITLSLARHAFDLCLDTYELYFIRSLHLPYHAILSVLVSALRIFLITAAADEITKQASKGLDPLHDVDRQHLNQDELTQITLLSNKLSQSPVEISACQFFNINRRVFTTIISLIVTYLLVLSQFHKESDSLIDATATIPTLPATAKN